MKPIGAPAAERNNDEGLTFESNQRRKSKAKHEAESHANEQCQRNEADLFEGTRKENAEGNEDQRCRHPRQRIDDIQDRQRQCSSAHRQCHAYSQRPEQRGTGDSPEHDKPLKRLVTVSKGCREGDGSDHDRVTEVIEHRVGEPAFPVDGQNEREHEGVIDDHRIHRHRSGRLTRQTHVFREKQHASQAQDVDDDVRDREHDFVITQLCIRQGRQDQKRQRHEKDKTQHEVSMRLVPRIRIV